MGNIPPTIDVFGNSEITRMLNQEVRLSVTVSDFEEGNNCCEATWVSDVDGNLGTGNALTHVFQTEGTRLITVSAEDSQGAVGKTIITLTIENNPPRTTLTKPTAGEAIIVGISYGLKGHAVDVNEPNSELDCSRLVWTSSNSSDPFPVTGCEPSVQFSTIGSRTLTLKATDPQGLSESKQVAINVVAPPDNLPPAVSISSPQNGITINIFELVTLSGSATDPEGNNPITYEWSVNWGEGKVIIGNSPTIAWDAFETLQAECEGSWDIRATLKATDSLGASSIDFVDLNANWICK
jgi:serine protease